VDHGLGDREFGNRELLHSRLTACEESIRRSCFCLPERELENEVRLDIDARA
jgi:hypothetical protein